MKGLIHVMIKPLFFDAHNNMNYDYHINNSIDENIVTDLKYNGVKISQSAIKAIPYTIDIQNANINPITINKWQDIKDKFVLITDEDNVIAIYDNNKLIYNPNKIKVSDVINYNCYEVFNISSVVNKRAERKSSRQGYVDLLNTKTNYNQVPKSIRYVFDRDWNAEASKEYYTKLLHQNKLGQYAERLEYAYTIIEDMIKHRRAEQTVGKKAVYTDWINKLTSKINVTELEMDALDKNMNIDIPKLIKCLNNLDKTVRDCAKFIGYEDDAIATFGYTKQRKHRKIER